jgi:hypothetical protein
VLPLPHLPAQAPAGSPQLPVDRTVSAPGSEFASALPGAPARPSVGNLPAPQFGQVADKASALQQQVGAMRPAADTQPLSGGMSGNSLYVLVIGSLLAGAAALGGVVRRLRRR